MAAIEGVQRIYLLARRITFFGFIAGAALWGLALLLRVWLGIAVLFLLLSFPLALGAILSILNPRHDSVCSLHVQRRGFRMDGLLGGG